MKHYTTPEVISAAKVIDSEGNEEPVGDRVLGLQVLFDERNHREGTAQLDLRDFPKKGKNLIVEVPLSDLMAALTTATLNREKVSDGTNGRKDLCQKLTLRLKRHLAGRLLS